MIDDQKVVDYGHDSRDDDKWCLILCFDSINHIDYTSMEALYSLITEIKHKYEDCVLLVTYNVHFNIYQSLKRAGIITLISEENIFGSINDAEIWWDQQGSNGKKAFKKDTNTSLYGAGDSNDMESMQTIQE